jgi:hypothetical protein
MKDLESATQKFGGRSMKDTYIASHRCLPPVPKPFVYHEPKVSPQRSQSRQAAFHDPDPDIVHIHRQLAQPGPAMKTLLPLRSVKISSTEDTRYLHLRSRVTHRPASGTLEEGRPLYSSFSGDGVFHLNLSNPRETPSDAFRSVSPTRQGSPLGATATTPLHKGAQRPSTSLLAGLFVN